MRIYTCCPHQGCTAYRDGLNFLMNWGIEPEIGMNESGHFFQFVAPAYWSKSKKRSFIRAIADLVVEMPPEDTG